MHRKVRKACEVRSRESFVKVSEYQGEILEEAVMQNKDKQMEKGAGEDLSDQETVHGNYFAQD